MPVFTSQLPSKDCYLDGANATTNRDLGVIAVGENNGATQVLRGLIHFDLSSIPTNAVVSAATLTLTINAEASDNARTINAYRVLRVWVENQATWNVYSTGNNWGTAGCSNTTSDREAASAGSGTQPNAGSGTVVMTMDNAKIQEMIAGSFTNNGWLLQVETESNDQVNYYSSEDATPGNRPLLSITYSVISGTSTITGVMTAVLSANQYPVFASNVPKTTFRSRE